MARTVGGTQDRETATDFVARHARDGQMASVSTPDGRPSRAAERPRSAGRRAERSRRASSRGPRGMVRWRASARQMAVPRGPQQKAGAASRTAATGEGNARARAAPPALPPTHEAPTAPTPRSGSRQRWAYGRDSSRGRGGIDRPVVPTKPREQGAARGAALGAIYTKRRWGGDIPTNPGARRRRAGAEQRP